MISSFPYGSRGLSRTAITAPGRGGSDKLAASSELRSAKTMAFPVGNSPTVTGNRTPRKSEKTPNHDATTDAASKASMPGRPEKTTGKLQECCPAESKNGTGSKARSFANAKRVPLRLSTLLGLMVIQGAALCGQAAQRPCSGRVSVLSLVSKSVGNGISFCEPDPGTIGTEPTRVPFSHKSSEPSLERSSGAA